jgi:hypothetical protein
MAESAIKFGDTGDSGGDSSEDDALNTYGTPFGYNATTGATHVWYREKAMGPGPNGPINHINVQENYADAFKGFRDQYANDKEGFKSLQAKLYNGGFYDGVLKAGELPKLGQFDKNTTTAINRVLSESAVSGDAIEDVIDNAANNAQAGSVASKPYQTNTENIKAAVKSLGPQFLGKDVPDDVVNEIVGRLHGSEDAAANGISGNEQAASPTQDWFQEQLKQLMPNTYAAQQEGQGFATVNKLVGGTGSAYNG